MLFGRVPPPEVRLNDYGGHMMPDTQGVPITVESWGWSRQGSACAENQDAFLNWPEYLLWAVADGMGGGEQGGFASKLVASSLMHVPRPESLDSHIDIVKRILESSNNQLRSIETIGISACTIVVLLVYNGSAACIWSGDSRCYLLRDDTLYLCTRDHTVRQRKIDNKELTIHEARRMVRSNVITRAIGSSDTLQLESVRFNLCLGDRFLLCSDGLSNVVSPENLSRFLGRPRAMDAALSIKASLDSLEQQDDATCVTVFLSAI